MQKLFTASCVAIVTTAMTFAIRANLIGELGGKFNLDNEQMGLVVGTAFWGFTISMILGGLICDYIGMKKLLVFAFIGHLVGIVLTIFSVGFWSLFISTLFIGLANGFVEAAVNPLVATIYPDKKTERLNALHVWFPGGIVIGGVAAYFLNLLEMGWQVQMAAIIPPTILYGVLFSSLKFPQTERVSSGVSFAEMFKSIGSPLFILMAFAMLLTAATELGTNQWIVELLGNVGVPAILLLVFINGLMAIGRLFAGKVEGLFSTSGMLLFSAVASAIGLLFLSFANGYLAFLAAAIFAVGICYFWPTMLAYVSKNIPQSGALGLSLMGGIGMLSVAFVLPVIGGMYDQEMMSKFPEYSLEELKKAPENSTLAILFAKVKLEAGALTLRKVAFIPAFLVVVFGFLYVKDRKKK